MNILERNVAITATFCFLLTVRIISGQAIFARHLQNQGLFAFQTEQDTLLVLSTMFMLHRKRRMQRRRRRVWAWPRPQNWFDLMVQTPYLDPLWKPNFRMERATFDELCRILRNDLTKQDTRFRRAVSLEKRIAVGLWRLATGNSYRSCGLQFGLGTSTAKMICQEFEQALNDKKDIFIRFPYTEDEVQEAINDFEDDYDFPQIVGAIDGCHIEINAPTQNHEDYYNRKQFYSVVLQGIVSSKLMFQHISVGFPGSIHDARILRLSRIFDMAEVGQILNAPTRDLEGVEIRPMLVGDSAYPLTSWLLKAFPERGNLLRLERSFNMKLNALRSVVERAFGMTKGRWRILLKKVEQKHETVPRTVIAACVLHNFCIMQGETYTDGDDRDPPDDQGDDDDTLDGDSTREAVMNYMVAQGYL